MLGFVKFGYGHSASSTNTKFVRNVERFKQQLKKIRDFFSVENLDKKNILEIPFFKIAIAHVGQSSNPFKKFITIEQNAKLLFEDLKLWNETQEIFKFSKSLDIKIKDIENKLYFIGTKTTQTKKPTIFSAFARHSNLEDKEAIDKLKEEYSYFKVEFDSIYSLLLNAIDQTLKHYLDPSLFNTEETKRQKIELIRIKEQLENYSLEILPGRIRFFEQNLDELQEQKNKLNSKKSGSFDFSTIITGILKTDQELFQLIHPLSEKIDTNRIITLISQDERNIELFMGKFDNPEIIQFPNKEYAELFSIQKRLLIEVTELNKKIYEMYSRL
jgi:hypothetical protein